MKKIFLFLFLLLSFSINALANESPSSYEDGFIYGYAMGFGDGYFLGSIDGCFDAIRGTSNYNSQSIDDSNLNDPYEDGYNDGYIDGVSDGYAYGYKPAYEYYLKNPDASQPYTDKMILCPYVNDFTDGYAYGYTDGSQQGHIDKIFEISDEIDFAALEAELDLTLIQDIGFIHGYTDGYYDEYLNSNENIDDETEDFIDETEGFKNLNAVNPNTRKDNNTLPQKSIKDYINFLLPIIISVIIALMFLGMFLGILSIFEPLSFLKKTGENIMKFTVTIIWYFALLPFALLYLPFMLYDKIKNHFKK